MKPAFAAEIADVAVVVVIVAVDEGAGTVAAAVDATVVAMIAEIVAHLVVVFHLLQADLDSELMFGDHSCRVLKQKFEKMSD